VLESPAAVFPVLENKRRGQAPEMGDMLSWVGFLTDEKSWSCLPVGGHFLGEKDGDDADHGTMSSNAVAMWSKP